MVEIEVYSTVGTSEVGYSSLAEFSAYSVARGRPVATDVKQAKNGVKDVVKMVAAR